MACTKARTTDTVVRDPVVIFEVLSRGTARIDRSKKTQEYGATPLVRRYVMLEPDQVGASVFSRASEHWVGHVLAQDALLRMPEIGIEVSLAELYVGVEVHDAAL